jgi:hypothetical protein
VDRAFSLALSRPARPEESKAALDFLDKQRSQIEADSANADIKTADARRKALEAFCLVVLNMNEFVYSN